jgi:uncharacterized membrane protein YoaK (UPF0700 family)
MTGNVVFVGFAIAGAPGFSLSASLSALLGFLVGAGAGGALSNRIDTDRGRLLTVGVAGETVLLTAALLVTVFVTHLDGAGVRDAVAALAAIAMGMQNAVVRRIAVPDLTTTVLTMTLTGIAADIRAQGWADGVIIRLLALLTMFGGAVLGALLVLHASPRVALGACVVLVALAGLGAAAVARRPADWQRPK